MPIAPGIKRAALPESRKRKRDDGEPEQSDAEPELNTHGAPLSTTELPERLNGHGGSPPEQANGTNESDKLPLEQSPAIPVKRGRGRPKGSKNKPRESTGSLAGLSDYDPFRDGPPEKRWRIAADTDQPNSRDEQTLAPAVQENGMPVKRRPGRPKGTKNKPKDTPQSVEHDSAPPAHCLPYNTTTDQLSRGDSEDIVARTVEQTGSGPASATPDPVSTPKRGRGRPKGSKNRPKDGTPSQGLTDRPNGLFSTPMKVSKFNLGNGASNSPSLADRSAKRKSAQTIINATANLSDEDGLEEEDVLARRIWGDAEAEEQDGEQDRAASEDNANEGSATPSAVTPVKRGPGRPKGSRKRRTPTPPPGVLPPHEQYFFHNRPGGSKTSHNTLASVSLLDHEEYFSLIREHVDPHEPEREFLEMLHSSSFPQWRFEMQEGFNVCLYGWGSKRKLLSKYAEWLCAQRAGDDAQQQGQIIVVNGYVPNLTIRDVLNSLATALLGANQATKLKLGSQPAETLDTLLGLLSATGPAPPVITLLIHSIDSPPLRRPIPQNILSRLAAHPRVHLLASADHPSFPLLWDSSLREAYNFVFHDCTTFAPYDVETVDAVESVHELFGRSGRRVGGKEGVGFVLKSLTENARGVYRVLVGEQLAALEDGMDVGGDGEAGIEYRVLYQKAVEEFLTGDEMNFRNLLKEFHDHQMIASRKDGFGTEFLWAPFRKEELEAILEDLVG